LARLRILWCIHVCVSQEILSLTENNRLRSSQPRQAPERQAVKKPHFFIKNLKLSYSKNGIEAI